uniref:Small ribosomal subunit protein mS38 n=1 Tax=Salvator merianae TaxID=96440 RepID=A0A8D0BYB8_SALMN
MLISKLTSQIVRVSRFTGCVLLRAEAPLWKAGPAVSANYCTHPSSKNGTVSQQWYALDPELEETLVPRKMSISPLESWLTIHYALPKAASLPERPQCEPAQHYDLPPCSPSTEAGDDDSEEGSQPKRDQMECNRLLKIRRRKMNRHKYKKLMKRRKFLRKKILERRLQRKQKRFERDLTRIWRQAGLKKPPAGLYGCHGKAEGWV